MKIIFSLLCFLTLSGYLPSAFAQGNIRGGGINGLAYSDTDIPLVERLLGSGASAVRLYFFLEDVSDASEAEYRAWFQNEVLPKMDELLNTFINQYGVSVLLSIHTPPAGRTDTGLPVDRALIPGSEYQWTRDLLIEMWGEIALRNNKYGNKLMYQLFSEPAPPKDASAWISLQKSLIDTIRDADSTPLDQQPTIFYMTAFGNPKATKDVNLSAARGDMGILANMYYPWPYTHQQTPSAKNSKFLKYPGCKKSSKPTGFKGKRNRKCNKRGIAKSIKKFVAFAKKNGLKKAAPELSVSRQAPGAPKFLKDVFKVLARADVGWFYFNFVERGNSPWRLDCSDNSGEICEVLDVSTPSARQQVLEKFFNALK